MELTRCIFCGAALTHSSLNQHDSRTKEHVYGDWFKKCVANDKIKMFTSDGDTTMFHRQTRLKKLWNRSVCKKCNNGWMSRLEEEVDPIVGKLTKGTDFNSLSLGEVETLARWTGKTSIVLGYLTPIPAIVPEHIRRTFLPDSPVPPQMHLFYQFIQMDRTLEGGYLQLGYGLELPVIGSASPSGLRLTLCVYNHMLTVDFPPMLTGLRYDLTNSVSAEVWPQRIAAGTTELNLTLPASIQDFSRELLSRICHGIKVQFDINSIHV